MCPDLSISEICISPRLLPIVSCTWLSEWLTHFWNQHIYFPFQECNFSYSKYEELSLDQHLPHLLHVPNRRVKPPPSKRAIKQSETSNNVHTAVQTHRNAKKYRQNPEEIQLDVRNKTVSNTRSWIRSAPRWSTACLLPLHRSRDTSWGEKRAKYRQNIFSHIFGIIIHWAQS